MQAAVRHYLIITGNYWAFTLTDGALRMLVLLHFHQLGYTPLQIAALFLFYEIFGVLTNLLGGWLGARIGLNRTMNIGLALQVIALALLALPAHWLSVPLVMVAQGLSGIAKDLNKMSAKSSIKMLLPAGETAAQGSHQAKLYKWVARLTGSKNALKGVGFFLGALLLTAFGFRAAVLGMALLLLLIWIASFLLLPADLGKAKAKPKFRQLFSTSTPVNVLSAARLFLFAARDVWFVVALPVFLGAELGWSFWQVGAFLAGWVIVYGIVQALAPAITARRAHQVPGAGAAAGWAATLAVLPLLMAAGLYGGGDAQTLLIAGLGGFALLFAINSSLHSYLIVALAREDGVSLDVGFYYMSNAAGRLAGTVLSGWIYQRHGLAACLVVAALFVTAAALIALRLPPAHAGELSASAGD